MLKKFRLLLITSILFLFIVLLGKAQDIEPVVPPPEDADVAITFPPPVFVLNGLVDIRGSVDALGMTNYFIEFRPLLITDDGSDQTEATPVPEEDRPWFPATLPGNQAVRNDVLGTWNTSLVRDGLYEIRLVVNVERGAAQVFRVSPIRVLNHPTDIFASLPTRQPLQATPTQLGGSQPRPPLAATPTPLGTGEPIITALTDANVRRGDDTSYSRVGALLTGESARVLGLSAFGSGWYYIEMDNGLRGFVAPSIVEFSGNALDLPRIQPPPPPTPPATAIPLTSANLQITGLRLDPAQPVCGQSFDVYINVQNTGSGATITSGILSVVDRNVRTSLTTGSTTGGFPVIGSGSSFVVVTTLTVDTFFAEAHDIVVTLDTSGGIPETNEGDNISSIRYTLQQGNCG